MFRHLTLFRFPESTARVLATLDADVAPHALRECGPMELQTRGFVPVFGGDSPLVESVGQFHLVAVGTSTRLLPTSIVTDALAERVAKIKTDETRTPGGKERKRLREEVISDLLPRAFVRSSRTLAYFDLVNGWLVIDTASRKRAEGVVSQIREAVGRFPATPMAPEESPSELMTDWLSRGYAPEPFLLGDECNLQDPSEAGAKWSGRSVDLQSDEVREHLRSGMRVMRLGLEFDDRLSCVLGEDLVVRKLRFHDVVLDEIQHDGEESHESEMRTIFSLSALEIARLLDNLVGTFGLPRPGDHE